MKCRLQIADIVKKPFPSSEVAAGSCATSARESGQSRKAAAFIGAIRVPQIAWSSLQSAETTKVWKQI